MFKLLIMSMTEGQHEELHRFDPGQEREFTLSGQVYPVFDPTSDPQRG